MNEFEFAVTNCKSKTEITKVLLDNPQARTPIVHRFGGGIYIREATYPPYCLIVGQEHVSEHMNVLLKGRIWVSDDSGKPPQLLEAPHMFVAKAGAKIGYTLEEVVWQNIYVTDSTDVEYLESILFKAPELLIEHQKQKLAEEILKHEEDRKDFIAAVNEAGWTLEDVEKVSKFREDCIPFPEGSYSVMSGASPIQGKGLFATGDIKEGQTIAPMRIEGKRTPAGYLTNHSKTPNAYVVSDESNLLLVAARDIHGMVGGDLGEEITIDYRQVMKINNLWRGAQQCLLQS